MPDEPAEAPFRAGGERLKAHHDPVLREIGELLRTGVTRPCDLLEEPEYQRVVERALRTVEGLDRARIAAQIRASGTPAGHDRRPEPAS